MACETSGGYAMGLSHRLELRQSQSLVMTPQLLQAIRLLQLSHLELATQIEAELERNPLLERIGDAAEDPNDAITAPNTLQEEAQDWSPDEPQIERGTLEADFGTSFDNVFPDDAMGQQKELNAADEGLMVSNSLPHVRASQNSDWAPDLEATLTSSLSLTEHLESQLDLATSDAQVRLIGRFLIDAIDESGYLSEKTGDIAVRLGIDEAHVLKALSLVQSFEPTGIGARNLRECLSLQLRERNRYDPAMQSLIAHLDLVARHEYATLRKLCSVDRDDLADMLAELRQLQPRPGSAFGGEPSQALVPDAFVRRTHDNGFVVELNNDTLPRILLNRAYHVKLMQNARTEADRTFLSQCLQSGDWLTRSLEQRARTILKVASEIVRHQEAFFTHGAAHLRPLNLKTIADAIEMHESTISRVTSNKAIGTERGVFPMKYFFSSAVAADNGGETHAAEAVRHRIRHLIDAELSARDVLSDDAIVKKLHENGINVARRTVAKYRESLRIPSSVERRRALSLKSR